MAFDNYQASAAEGIGRLRARAQDSYSNQLDPAMFNTFQAQIPGQTVSAINMARAGVDRMQQQGGLASGVASRMKAGSVDDAIVQAANQRLTGYRSFQNLAAQNQSANDAMRAGFDQAAARLAAQMSLGEMQQETAFRGQDTQRDIAQMQIDAQRNAMFGNFLSGLGSGVSKGLGNLAGGIFN